MLSFFNNDLYINASVLTVSRSISFLFVQHCQWLMMLMSIYIADVLYLIHCCLLHTSLFLLDKKWLVMGFYLNMDKKLFFRCSFQFGKRAILHMFYSILIERKKSCQIFIVVFCKKLFFFVVFLFFFFFFFIYLVFFSIAIIY